MVAMNVIVFALMSTIMLRRIRNAGGSAPYDGRYASGTGNVLGTLPVGSHPSPPLLNGLQIVPERFSLGQMTQPLLGQSPCPIRNSVETASFKWMEQSGGGIAFPYREAMRDATSTRTKENKTDSPRS